MANPVSKIRRRLGASVQFRVDRSVELRTEALMKVIHGLSVQLSETATAITGWRRDAERSEGKQIQVVQELAMSVDKLATRVTDVESSVSLISDELRALIDEFAEIRSK